MKKYVLILLSLYSIGSYATTHDASTDNGNNNNKLLVQLVDTKLNAGLSNMDDKLTRVEKANQEAMAELNDKVDTKLADKFKQLDDRAGDINFWFTLIGLIGTFVGIVIPLIISVFGWFLRKKVNDNIDKSKQELESFEQESKSKIKDQLAYAEKILALIKENHSRSKQLTEKQEEMRKQPPLEVTDENKDDIAKIIRVTEEQPENQLSAEDWFIRGLDAANKQEYYEAVTYFSKAIKLSGTDDDSVNSYYNRGTAKLKLGQYSEAIQDYDEAIKLNSRFVEAYNNRGAIKATLGQYAESIQDYDKATELNPKYEQAYYNRGTAKAKLGQYTEAIQDYDKAIELNPKYAQAYYNRGNAKTRFGDYNKAIQDYDKAIELNSEFAKAYYNRGNNKTKLRQYSEAIKDYDKAIGLEPTYVRAHFNKSCAYALQKDKAQALIWLDKALQLGCPVADIMQDSDWQHYRNDAEFKELINKYDKNNHANQS